MKFMAIIYGNKDLWESFPAEDWPKAIADQNAFNARYTETGELILAYGLGDELTARTVKVRNGERTVTDGPYVEAKEFASSIYVLDCEDEARAVAIAADIPFASFRAVEVWPVLHGTGHDS